MSHPEALELAELFKNRDKNALEKLGGVDGVLRRLGTHPERGLPRSEIDSKFADRIAKYGANRLPEPPTQSLLSLIFEGLQDKTLIMLIVSALVSLVLGVYEDPQSGWIEGTAILCAVVVVVMVSSLNDYSKEQQFRKLNAKKNDTSVKVQRDGQTVLVSVYDIVVGDVIVIDTGDIICADGLYLNGFNMKCDESTMTGESDAMKKSESEPFLLASCQVIEGVGRMVACAVGRHSIAGGTMLLLQKEQEDTPLQIKLESLADQIAKMGLAAASLILVSLLVKLALAIQAGTQSTEADKLMATILKYVISSITVVVVAVPEGLPLAVTIALAYSMTKMLKDNNLVRHLEACETMGGATTICSDKTGTLTTNRMTVMKAYITGKRYEDVESVKKDKISSEVLELLHTSISVNSVARKIAKDEKSKKEFMGSKTECALLQFSEELGQNYEKIRADHPVVKLIPFSSARKRSSTVIAHSKGYALFTTGASEIVLSFSDKVMQPDGNVRPMEDSDRKTFSDVIESFATQSLRTIGLAVRICDKGEAPANNDWTEEHEKRLAFIGIVGIKDPVRTEVPAAVRRCQTAGIVVRMVTGDNIVTARAIAKDCGILRDGEHGIVIEGPEFRQKSEAERISIAPDIRVMARSSPTDKFQLIQALKARGHVVAVTGDGTNDAPALKEAHVGFAMGITGTEVSKEASDIILMDDNFNSIVKAVSWGRNVYDSIRKFLQFQMTVNLVAVLLAFIGAVTNSHGEAPLKPVQLLWVNLIMDTMAALALATDEPTPDMLKRQPYGKNDKLVTNRMWVSIIGQALFQLGVNLLVLYHGEAIFEVQKDSIEHLTVVFNMFVLCQVFNEINSRKLYGELNVLNGIFSNYIFVLIMLFTMSMQYLIIQYGGDFASTRPLTHRQWGLCIGLAALGLPWGFALKFIPVPAEKKSVVAGVQAPREHSAVGAAAWGKAKKAMRKTQAVSAFRSAGVAASLRRVHRIITTGFSTRTARIESINSCRARLEGAAASSKKFD
eukprot:m51a1_g10969 putative p-type atpase (1014) ;mRNA; f:262400-266204